MADRYDFGNKYLILERKMDDHIKAHNNPHGVTKYQLGLGDVENIAPKDMPLSDATKAYTDENFTNNLEIIQSGDVVTIRFLSKQGPSGEPEVIAEDSFAVTGEATKIEGIEFCEAQAEGDVNTLKVWFVGTEEPLICAVPDIIGKTLFDGTVADLIARIDAAGQVDDVLVNGVSVLGSDKIARIEVPTKTSDLDNDGDGTNPFLTQHQDISGKADKSEVQSLATQVATKQEQLVSGENIKTINNQSLLGSGNIDIEIPTAPVEDVTVNGQSVVVDRSADIKIKTINGQPVTGEGNIEVQSETIFSKNELSGDIIVNANANTSTTVSASSGVSSLTINLPETISQGFIAEVNFRGYMQEHLSINKDNIVYVQFGRRVDSPELDINAVISYLFYHDGISLLCYVSSAQYSV